MFKSFNSSATRAAVGTLGMGLCASICLLGAVAPAHADTFGSVTRSRVVSYADLDLSNAAGRATLEHRIKVAARSVCMMNDTSVEAMSEENRCMRRALAAAQPAPLAIASR